MKRLVLALALAVSLVQTQAAQALPLDGLHVVPAASSQMSRSHSIATPTRAALRGTATWYAYRIGQAAAGPALRAYLGRNWRGRTVVVWTGSRHITVRLTDWCWCPRGNRLIDLDVRSFRRLASPSRGILSVTVRLP